MGCEDDRLAKQDYPVLHEVLEELGEVGPCGHGIGSVENVHGFVHVHHESQRVNDDTVNIIGILDGIGERIGHLVRIRDTTVLELVSEWQPFTGFRVQIQPLFLVPDVTERSRLPRTREARDQYELVICF